MKDTIYAKFKEVVETHPDSIAIRLDDRCITYSRLDQLVNSIMSKFYDERPAFVGIVMNHGIEQIAAMLAVLKSGAAYLPAEPSLPRDRINYMMQNAGVTLVITDRYCHDLKTVTTDLPDRSTPKGVAYVLYTSGTSGRPKGVIIENHSVANYTEAFEAEFHIVPGDVMLQYSVCSFDIFVEEVFATLLNGATLCIPPVDLRNGSVDDLMDFCRRHGVTIIDGFPYLISDINRRPSLLPKSTRLIISGGDVIRENYITNLRNRGVKIYNTYGPSETTVCSNYFRVDNAQPLADGTFPVGKPVKGVVVKILDKNLHEVKRGEVGEICIFGEGVGRGYMGNVPEQKNFVGLPDGRMYRSGDLGYLLSDGNIVFLHRRDDQVMILGRRVEPEEVENILNTCPCVDRGVVRAFLDDNGLHYLVAYIVPQGSCTLHDIRQWLGARLVDFMIPEFFVKMKSIPLTRRGKVNVDALPVVMKEGVVA